MLYSWLLQSEIWSFLQAHRIYDNLKIMTNFYWLSNVLKQAQPYFEVSCYLDTVGGPLVIQSSSNADISLTCFFLGNSAVLFLWEIPKK